ncbi:MAG: SagB/ThcOx family dehydrogenase [Acidobacteria bacterium]|nr:SagB/ThcOx family dehydrogenase [Acidobacteriota bacterium]
MPNADTEAAWRYHNATRHSPESVRRSARGLDWSNQPLPFKIYRDLEPFALPAQLPTTGVAALSAIAADTAAAPDGVPDLAALAHLFYFSAGITKRRRYPGGEILFRAASCTGALYEIELYLVCGDRPDLPAGVYHFNPADFALRRLRQGDYRRVLLEATAGEDSMARAAAAIISTGTYWRNAWKYGARTYRHFGWDNGTVLANLLAAAAALGCPARLLCGFVDAEVNRLLGLDTHREVSLSIISLGRAERLPPEAPAMAPLRPVPPSRKETDYPEMRDMHEASSLAEPGEVLAWRDGPLDVPLPAPLALRTELPGDGIEEVVLRRGSTRRFARRSITLAQLSAILARSTRGIAADFLSPFGARLNDLYIIVNAVESLAAGAYFYDTGTGALEPLKVGDFRRTAAFLALEQDLAGDAAAAVFFLADLARWLARFGNRGYRAVELEAGILGGKVYLAAYAQKLGATGLTFYDDEVSGFFSPHAAGNSAIFLTAVGHPAHRRG